MQQFCEFNKNQHWNAFFMHVMHFNIKKWYRNHSVNVNLFDENVKFSQFSGLFTRFLSPKSQESSTKYLSQHITQNET